MTKNWKKRLKETIENNPNLTMKGVSLAAGLSETVVRDILVRDRSPQVENFLSIAKAADVDPSWLLFGDEAKFRNIDIIGKVLEDEKCEMFGWPQEGSWPDTPWQGGDVVTFKMTSAEPVAVLVQTNNLEPSYYRGDIIVASMLRQGHIEHAIGKECVVSTGDAVYIKFVFKYGHTDKYTLRSRRSLEPDIEGVDLDWAAPVNWIKRNG
ncbi:MAG: helix-turn-helix domain-containing protein [Hyphomicrobiaceae bacterium]|nr:helix-turn-helix domain-containing protein [Hyphomicrobiaceae bacterium]